MLNKACLAHYKSNTVASELYPNSMYEFQDNGKFTRYLVTGVVILVIFSVVFIYFLFLIPFYIFPNWILPISVLSTASCILQALK